MPFVTDETNAEEVFGDATLGLLPPDGGRAGASPIAWKLPSEEIERLRQELLARNDVGRVTRVLRDYGIEQADEAIVSAVKRYNFDSQRIVFQKDNYNAWCRLASSIGTVDDVRYMVHEIAEVRELQQVQQQTGFDYNGASYTKSSDAEKAKWRNAFNMHYLSAHGRALEAEYNFLFREVRRATNGAVRMSRTEAAAIDPNRDEGRDYMLVDGFVLKTHPRFDEWQARGSELVRISQSTSARLGLSTRLMTRSELLLAVKRQRIASS